MFSTAMRLVGVDLQHQLARLRVQAEGIKNRAIDEAKRKAIDVGIMIGLALFGLFFVLLTLIVALVALYVWVDMKYGPLAGLAVVGGTTAILAALLFIIAARRGKKSEPGPKPAYNSLSAASAHSVASRTPAYALPKNASFVDAFTHNLTNRTAAATNEALDSASDAVRKSSPATILATVATAAIIGVLVGRQRR